MSSVTNLLNLDRNACRAFFQEMGEKAFHGDQVYKWMHQFGSDDFSQMSNLGQALRENLKEKACVIAPEIAHENISSDGTIKWLMRLEGGNFIETVYIPEEGRATLCVSSQVGCALNCSFCSTGRQGFNRNLETFEIIGQVWQAMRRLNNCQGRQPRAITNVVMMGMGEPLLNYENVVRAMDIMMDDNAYGLSKYRVTLSTSGVVPHMRRLAEDSPVALALSLHAANDELRNELVPINKKYPLKELMQACRDYFHFRNEPKRQITMEYVMLAGVNDTPADAKQLIALLRGIPAKVNLIPFNPFPHAPYACSSPETIARFREQLLHAGLNAITRKTRGDDITAACGQLVGVVIDKTRRSHDWQKAIAAVDGN